MGAMAVQQADPQPRIGWLAIADQVVSLRAVLATPRTRAEWLAPYRGRSHAVRCLCVTPPIPMGVKYYTSLGVYALYPLTRQDPGRHAATCPLGYPPGSRADHRVATAAPPAIRVTEAGYVIEPAWPLQQAAPDAHLCRQPDALAPSPARGGVSRGRRGVALATLLEALWVLAGLHQWNPAFAGKRSYATVMARLRQAAETIRLRRQPLRDWLYLPVPYRPDQREAVLVARRAWVDRLAPSRQGRRPYGYVVGIGRAVRRAAGAIELRLRQTPLRVWLPLEVWQYEAERWGLSPTPPDHVDPFPWPVAWLALVTWHQGQMWGRALAALTLTDDHTWLPCASDHERRLLQRLVTEGRRFVKPLQAGGLGWPVHAIMPDAVLEDRRDRCALEVVGRLSDPAYAERWREKQAWYTRHGWTVWAWDPVGQADMPPLPPPERRDPRHHHEQVA